MTREEVDVMWQKAIRQSIRNGEQFIRYNFAQLVIETEREACAKECEHTAVRMGSEWMAHHCAAAIRARGEHE